MDTTNLLTKCSMCPHSCKINRNIYNGRCGSGSLVKIAKADVFMYEEPCLSGTRGSGAVFFSNCNLRCVFCQNSKISSEGYGEEITVSRLAKVFLDLQAKGVHNINLVTPTTYVYQIIEALDIAKKNGLHIPIVYNSNGYESVETLKLLKGYIDIYVPDFKYAVDSLGEKYSNVANYRETAIRAITEMAAQQPQCILDSEGIMQKGVIIRHLVLPNNLLNSKMVLKNIQKNFKGCFVSVMAQYFPTHKAKEYPEISRKLTKKEYDSVCDYFYTLGLENGYMQELGEHEEEYVPDFNLKY